MRVSINHPEMFATVFESVTRSKLHRPITGISTDSRDIHHGDLYIAIVGEKVDGHKFLIQVEKAGAVAALVSNLNISIDMQQIKVSDAIKEIAKISHKWRMRFNIPVIVITKRRIFRTLDS